MNWFARNNDVAAALAVAGCIALALWVIFWGFGGVA